jgi:predicted RNA binding protein YcfA (HicA-like mRNA interferase family)
MAGLKPVSHRELVSRLRRLGFEGPYSGGKHLLMVRRDVRLILPNVHSIDIGVALLTRILRQAGISREAWDSSA